MRAEQTLQISQLFKVSLRISAGGGHFVAAASPTVRIFANEPDRIYVSGEVSAAVSVTSVSRTWLPIQNRMPFGAL